jgi:glycerol-3-phosphate acyltransferase PlsY
MNAGRYVGIFLLSYLVGAIPFGLIITKLVGGVDVREYGSKRSGATNVMRVLGTRWALFVFLLDFLKGTAGVLIARALGAGAWGETGGALAAMVGHIAPIYVGFRGGRGVATAMGGVMAMLPWAFLAAMLSWLLVVKLTRYVSLGSILAGIAAVVVMAVYLALGSLALASFLYSVAVALIIIVSHHDNIRRLLAGTENKFGQRVQTQ